MKFSTKSLLPALLLTGMSSFAQRSLSLEEAIATALQNNYDIQLSRNDSMVAALDYSYRNAAFLPTLNGTLGKNWNQNTETYKFKSATRNDTTGKSKSNTLTANLALNWTLFDGLKMFTTRNKLEEYIKLGELGIRNQVVNTVALVINNYYNIVRQKQQLRAIQEQMSLNEERVKLAQYKLDIGVGTKPDVLQSQVDLNAQKAAILNQETLISQLKADLNRLMVTELTASYEVADSIPVNPDITLGDIQNNIENTNPLLLINKKNIDIAELTIKERKADFFPTISFNSAYNLNRTNNTKNINPFATPFRQVRGLNYGLSASIPIFNRFNTRRLVKQADLDLQYQQLVYESQRSQVNLDVINAFKDYEQQKKSLELEEANILLARENVDIVFQTYKLGAATFIQLREAQKSLEDAYNRLIAARYNTKLAETELLRLKGEIVR